MTFHLLWDSNRRGYVAIKCYDGTWFIQADLGVGYAEALVMLGELNGVA